MKYYKYKNHNIDLKFKDIEIKHLKIKVMYYKHLSKYRLEGLIFATVCILLLFISLVYILNSRIKSLYSLHLFNTF